MRSLAHLAMVLLAACATAPQEPLRQGEACDIAGTERFIGQQGTSETGAAILSATHSTILRWAPPGTMLTMDYSPNRVTVRLGPDGKITGIRCG